VGRKAGTGKKTRRDEAKRKKEENGRNNTTVRAQPKGLSQKQSMKEKRRKLTGGSTLDDARIARSLCIGPSLSPWIRKLEKGRAW